MNRKTLHLFGRPRLKVDGEHMEIKSRKGAALLAYLAVADRPVSRDVLAALLWPEYDQTRARANLRRTLYNLNQMPIAQLLEADQESIHLVPGETGEIDAQRFTALLDETPEPDTLSRAAELYQADFLAGFYLPDSEPFEEWATVHRERYRRRALEALETLGAQYLASGDVGGAERCARRQLEIDNLREPAWRQLMEALARGGRRAEALAEYENCRFVLQEELGVAPATETAALAALLREGADEGETIVEPAAAVTLAPSDVGPAPESPYRGLFAFREEDAPFFFGREEFTELLTTAVANSSIVAVIGPSGSGKSSVVNAGLLAQIRQTTNWAISSFRPGKRPFHALAEALISHLEDDLSETQRLVEIDRLAAALRGPEVRLYDVVGRIRERSEANRLLLVADQFEELYTLMPDEDLRQRFLETVLELVFDQQFRPNPHFTLVLTLRADFTGQALAHRPLGDAIQEADVKLGPMTRAELRRAIAHPAQRLEVTFEPGLVERILDDVGDEPGNLPLLEFALANLWDKQEGGRLTHHAYEAIGRVEGALARHADAVFDGLTAEQQEQARRVFIQLVRPGDGTEDTRRLATRAELGADWALLPLLADARLVVTGRDAAGNETAEIVHEALIRSWDRLRRWMATDREFRVWQERLRVAVRDWETHERDRSGLLRGLALTTAESWLAERPADLGAVEKEFIVEGTALRREREAERLQAQMERERLRRRFTMALGLGMVLALVLAVAALLQWRTATAERDAAELALVRQIAAQSDSLLDDDLPLALLLAVEGVRRVDVPETQQALSRALAYSPDLKRFFYLKDGPDEADLLRAGLFPDRRIALGDRDGVRVWDLVSGKQLPDREVATTALVEGDITLSPSGFTATVGQTVGGRFILEVFDADTGEKLHELPVGTGANTIEFSPDGDTLAAVTPGTITLWDLTDGKQLQKWIGGDHPHVSFSPDGRFIAGGGREGVLHIWDVESGDVIETVPAHDDQVFATAFGPDGRTLATSGADGSVRFWDAVKWVALSEPLTAHNGRAHLLFSPDGQVLVSFGEDGLLQRWLPAMREKTGTPLRGHQPGVPLEPVFDPSGQTLISAMIVETAGGNRPQIIEWQLNKPEALRLVGHSADVLSVAFAGEAEVITSVDGDGQIRNWSPDGQFLSVAAEVDWPGEWWGIGLDPSGRLLVRGKAEVEGPVVVYDAQTGEQLRTLDEPPLPVARFDFTADGQLLAGAGCGDGTLVPQRCDVGQTWVWNPTTGEVAATFSTPELVHNDVAISPDGRLAAAGAFSLGGSQAAVFLWDVATGSLLAEVEARPTDEIPRFGLAFGPEGDMLTANGRDGFTLFDIGEDGRLETRHMWDDLEPIVIAAFSPGGELLAAGDEEGAVYFWDVANGERLRREEVHTRAITSLEFVADGGRLLTSSVDDTLALLDLGHLLRSDTEASSSPVDRACSRANRNLTPAEWQRHFGEEPYRATCPEKPSPES